MRCAASRSRVTRVFVSHAQIHKHTYALWNHNFLAQEDARMYTHHIIYTSMCINIYMRCSFAAVERVYIVYYYTNTLCTRCRVYYVYILVRIYYTCAQAFAVVFINIFISCVYVCLGVVVECAVGVDVIFPNVCALARVAFIYFLFCKRL